MVSSKKLVKSYSSSSMDVISYMQFVGKLFYLTNTKFDITFFVQQLSQFLDAPNQIHLKAAHRVLRYLKGTPSLGLFYPLRNSLQLKILQCLIGLLV